jgi:hypothetical protein
MKLVNSIIILEREDPGPRTIDRVLLVKHPDGCDPIERIQAGINDFIKAQQYGLEQSQANPLTWSDLFRMMVGWDWSAQGLFIEEAPLWTVINSDQSLLHNSDVPA